MMVCPQDLWTVEAETAIGFPAAVMERFIWHLFQNKNEQNALEDSVNKFLLLYISRSITVEADIIVMASHQW